MGLKTTNYEIKDFGITLSEAYARLTNVSIDINGHAIGTFEISQTREDLAELKRSLERVIIHQTVNKDLPIYSQLYTKAKEEYFSNWEDDIIAETEVE